MPETKPASAESADTSIPDSAKKTPELKKQQTTASDAEVRRLEEVQKQRVADAPPPRDSATPPPPTPTSRSSQSGVMIAISVFAVTGLVVIGGVIVFVKHLQKNK